MATPLSAEALLANGRCCQLCCKNCPYIPKWGNNKNCDENMKKFLILSLLLAGCNEKRFSADFPPLPARGETVKLQEYVVQCESALSCIDELISDEKDSSMRRDMVTVKLNIKTNLAVAKERLK